MSTVFFIRSLSICLVVFAFFMVGPVTISAAKAEAALGAANCQCQSQLNCATPAGCSAQGQYIGCKPGQTNDDCEVNQDLGCGATAECNTKFKAHGDNTTCHPG